MVFGTDSLVDGTFIVGSEAIRHFGVPAAAAIGFSIAGTVYRLFKSSQNSGKIKANAAIIATQADQIEALIRITHMWEKYGYTEEEWNAIPEEDRNRLLAQNWTVVRSEETGTPVIALSADAMPQSMAEYVKSLEGDDHAL